MKLILFLFLVSTSVFALTQVEEPQPANMNVDPERDTLEQKKERVYETSQEVKQREEYDSDYDGDEADEDDEEDDEEDDADGYMRSR
jgi:phosphopantothenoylcysteine synthetase/decarboxylase